MAIEAKYFTHRGDLFGIPIYWNERLATISGTDWFRNLFVQLVTHLPFIDPEFTIDDEEIEHQDLSREHCNRCTRELYNCRIDFVDIDGQQRGMSAGCYTASDYQVEMREGWGKFMNDGERVICDLCMWKDPRYQKVYGTQQFLLCLENKLKPIVDKTDPDVLVKK